MFKILYVVAIRLKASQACFYGQEESVGTIFYLYKEIYFMAKKKKKISDNVKTESHPADKNKAVEAHNQADKDIEQDPDLTPRRNG